MKLPIRTLTVCAAAAALSAGAVAIGTPTQAAPPGRSTAYVELYCKNGFRGSAGGQYGGVPFSIACNFDRQSTMIEGVEGTNYGVRMGVETLSGAFDCFFSGDSGHVQENCTGVRLTIR